MTVRIIGGLLSGKGKDDRLIQDFLKSCGGVITVVGVKRVSPGSISGGSSLIIK